MKKVKIFSEQGDVNALEAAINDFLTANSGISEVDIKLETSGWERNHITYTAVLLYSEA